MFQQFDSARNFYYDVDENGTVRQLLHTHAPVDSKAHTPQLAAAEYLQEFGPALGLTPPQLKNLSQPPSSTLEDAPVEYRFHMEKHQFDSATVAFYQTDLGLPVWQAGVAVQMKLDPFRILSSQSTLHPDLEVKRPSADQVKRAESIDEKEFAHLLGLGDQNRKRTRWNLASLRIDRRQLVLFRYESDKRAVSPPQSPTHTEPEGLPTLPLPPIADGIENGKHYVCAKLDFSLDGPTTGLINWVAIVAVEPRTVLYLRAFVDNVNGLVFECDPVTNAGGPLPSANNAALNPVRVSVTLAGLAGPANGTQSLVGDNVQVSDVEPPVIAPPTEPGGTDFSFDARTNNFGAVNAYYHGDKFFRLLDGMGFTRAGYFGGSAFPSSIDDRGAINTADGIEINAHCVGTMGGVGILRTTFALADLGDTVNPISIACDHRVVLHELGGHGVLYNHVNSANFGFSHSAGDSVAAILNDPGSQAADRFLTFPWIGGAVARRHDRTPAAGWGYAGSIALNPFNFTLDRGGYNNEQILSSAHFRIYRSIGGDSANLASKGFAARMMVYLIMRAIGTLTPATNPNNASGWVTALMTADRGDWVGENITGGAYSKVIRWAFEKQGLYQPNGAAMPNNNEGAPPAVDVYIDDGRAGLYQYQPNWWSCQSIWNRRANDGGTTHEEPVTNQTNFAYVKIKNRGMQTATNVTVRAYSANPAAGLSYPIDWTPMTTAQLAGLDVPPNNAGDVTVGPFQWVPKHVGHECIFMIASANGDSSNVDNIQLGDSMPEWRLVPNDNNIGQRNVFPISGGGTSGLTADFDRLTFELKNPHDVTARAEVQVALPAFLENRGWKIAFANAGGAGFPLRSGESREIVTRLIPGADFAPADVPAGDGERTIHLIGRVGGMVVGGMSYVIDPHLLPPRHGEGHASECNESAAALVRCLDLHRDKVRKVRVRRVNVDIDFDDDHEE